MTTWGSPIRHPWFDKPSMKRRLSPTIQDSTVFHSPSSCAKRRRMRCDSLEHGFADLTLEHTPPPNNSSSSAYPEPFNQPSVISQQALGHHEAVFPIADNSPRFSPSLASQNPVEYPVVVPIPIQDIKMATSSWYEPEKDRIVVTSLESSESESDEPESFTDVTISPALMDRMKKQDAPPVLKMQPPGCQALVLYRPITLGLARPEEEAEQKDGFADRANVTQLPTPIDHDAMDIEP